MIRSLSFLIAALLLVNLHAFAPSNNVGIASRGTTTALNEKEDGNKNGFLGGFFNDIKGMGSNLDDVIDDFVYKRMGAGEQWYGKRKYKPSGSVEGDYNGMGLTDQLRIEVARARKEEIMAKRERQRAAEEAAKRKS